MCDQDKFDGATHIFRWQSDEPDNVTTMFDVYAERAAKKGIIGLAEWIVTGRVLP